MIYRTKNGEVVEAECTEDEDELFDLVDEGRKAGKDLPKIDFNDGKYYLWWMITPINFFMDKQKGPNG